MKRMILVVALLVALAGVAEAVHLHRGTQWSKVRVGMTGQQVGQLLGRCSNEYAIGRDTWVQTWNYTDRCQGFDQDLYFHVWYQARNGRWLTSRKDVDWMTESYFKGSGVYKHHDVSDEWQ